MDFQTKMLLGTFAVTVLLGLIIVPILRKLKVGQIERTDGPQSHLKKQGTPTMGGIIIMLGIIIATCCAYVYYKGKDASLAQNLIPILCLISIAFVSYLVWGLKIGTETYMPFANKYVTIPIWLYIPFAILVILATTNAINLTDGIDGLSSSVSTIIITCLTIIATMFGTKEIIVFGAIVIGATLGFLMFNIYPAKAFMGDTGSLFLGGVVSGIALYLKMPLLLLIIAIIPVLETLSVIIQVAVFKKTGKRVFKMAPLHHHFELSGWRENQVVMLFSVITLISCVIGLKII